MEHIKRQLKLSVGGFKITISNEDEVLQNAVESVKESSIDHKNVGEERKKPIQKVGFKTYNLNDVSKHNTPDDCWVVGKL